MLKRSNLTQTQFETLLVDQLGSDLANKRLTREEMTRLRRFRDKISRGAFTRTLQQAKTNVSESINTILLLGYAGILDSPGLAPYYEASERVRGFKNTIRRGENENTESYRRMLDSLLADLEQADEALKGKRSDT